MTAAHSIYVDEMTSLMHGSPLWEPDCRPDEVSVGDVGYIRQGRFCRLFNATLSPRDDRNVFGVPDGFEQLILDERAMTHRRLPPGALVSRFVTNSGADVQFTNSVLQAGAGFNFACKRDRGAALIINSEALRRDSEQLGAFKKYMLKHSNSWLSFANNPPNSRDISLHDLVFVTGRDNTADWAVAAFLEKSTSGGISFQAGYTPVMGASFSVWGNWEGLRSLYANCGPPVQRAAVGSDNLVIANTQNQPGLVCSADMQLYDQCIFMRGFKIMDRKSQVYGMMKLKVSANSDGFGWIKAPLFESKTTSTASEAYASPKPKITSGALSKRDDSVRTRTISMSTQDSSGVYEKDQPELMYIGGSNEISPAEYLLSYILHVSEAKLALIHDNDISAVVKACKDYTTFIEALREVSPRVIVDSDGVGSISIDDSTSTTPHELVTQALDLQQIQADINTSRARLTEVRQQLSLLSNTSPAATREDTLQTQIEALGGGVAKAKPSVKPITVQSPKGSTEVNDQKAFPTRTASLGTFESEPGQKKVEKPSAKKSLSLENQRTDKELVDKLSRDAPGRLPAPQAELDIMRKERMVALSNRSQLLQERDELQKKLRALQEARRAAAEQVKSKEEGEMERKTSDQALKAELIRKEKQMKERQQRLEARARLLERARAPAFEAERRACNSLLAYFSPMVASSTDVLSTTSTPSSAGKATSSEKGNSPGAGWVPLRSKKEREEEFFIGGSKSGKKSSSKATPMSQQRSNSSSKKLVIPLTIMTLLESNGIAIPATLNDVPDTINEIQKKLQWLNSHETEATASNLAMMEASLQALPVLTQ